MSEIRGIDGILHAAVGFGSSAARTAPVDSGGVAVQDRVEISELARALSVDANPEFSQNTTAKIAEIRAQIRAGTYLTADKLNVALDRALENVETTAAAPLGR